MECSNFVLNIEMVFVIKPTQKVIGQPIKSIGVCKAKGRGKMRSGRKVCKAGLRVGIRILQ